MSCGVTIQMKPLFQKFSIELFTSSDFTQRHLKFFYTWYVISFHSTTSLSKEPFNTEHSECYNGMSLLSADISGMWPDAEELAAGFFSSPSLLDVRASLQNDTTAI